MNINNVSEVWGKLSKIYQFSFSFLTHLTFTYKKQGALKTEKDCHLEYDILNMFISLWFSIFSLACHFILYNSPGYNSIFWLIFYSKNSENNG